MLIIMILVATVILELTRRKMIIGLSGSPASGKDTVAEYLEKEKGFDHISLSSILRELVTKDGLELNLENLTKVGNAIGTKLVEIALSRVNKDNNTVVSSIRQVAEIETLKKEKDFFMVFVDAAARIRFERLKSRGRAGDSKTFEEFVDVEYKQSDGKTGGMNLTKCKEMSDYVIENNGTMEEFYEKIEQTFNAIKKRVSNE